jgi:hypothetical protein
MVLLVLQAPPEQVAQHGRGLLVTVKALAAAVVLVLLMVPPAPLGVFMWCSPNGFHSNSLACRRNSGTTIHSCCV